MKMYMREHARVAMKDLVDEQQWRFKAQGLVMRSPRTTPCVHPTEARTDVFSVRGKTLEHVGRMAKGLRQTHPRVGRSSCTPNN